MTVPILLHPVDSATKRRIANFGIELEVLTRDSVGNGDGWCCEGCDGDYDDWCDHDIPESSGAAASYLTAFSDAGLMSASQHDVHDYHCWCSRCSHHRSFPHFTAQRDPTVGIEFISRVLNAFDDHEVVAAAIEAHEAGMTGSGWRPDGVDNNGNHIHISNSGLDVGRTPFQDGTKRQARGLITTLLATGSWNMTAAGGCRQLRSYNGSKPTKVASTSALGPGGYSHWLSDKYGTLEFRLWNTPAVADRIAAHVGLSLAIMRWAFTQVIHDRSAIAAMSHGAAEKVIVKNIDALREILLDAVPTPFRKPSADALELLAV